MIGARSRNRTCEEASPLSRGQYVPCGLPAVCIIDNGDSHPYWMCRSCASHNVNNRGGIEWRPSDPVGELLEDVAELLEGYADVRDGDMGRQQPNAAATMLGRVMACIEKAGA